MTQDWHSWFAYWPVKTPTGWVWLGWVDKRAINVPWEDFYSDGATLTTTHHEYRRKDKR
ncbi:MAG: hypothetical protein ACTHYO_10360 [Micrococcaceae bacterium]